MLLLQCSLRCSNSPAPRRNVSMGGRTMRRANFTFILYGEFKGMRAFSVDPDGVIHL